jgi:hypothetical protein
VSNETTGPGPISAYGDLSRRARRELEAKGINPDEALAAFNQTGNIEALTGSIAIIPPVSQAAPQMDDVLEAEVVAEEVPAAETEAEAVTGAAEVTVSSQPGISPVPASSIFPVGLSRRDEVSIEQRLTAEIPTIVPAEEAVAVADEAEAVADEAEVPAEEAEAELDAAANFADPVDAVLEDELDVELSDVGEDLEDVVPIDLEPVEVEAVRIDQREDREEITNEFEPFTITTTSTGIIPTTSHALVLPTLPEDDPDLIAAMNQTGEIVITGQITLPVGIASIGAETASLDTADIDLIVEDVETGSGQDLAPVSAAQAVSSFSGTAINVTMPKRSSEKLPVILAIAAAVLAVGVVGLFVANYFLRVF